MPNVLASCFSGCRLDDLDRRLQVTTVSGEETKALLLQEREASQAQAALVRACLSVMQFYSARLRAGDRKRSVYWNNEGWAFGEMGRSDSKAILLWDCSFDASTG